MRRMVENGRAIARQDRWRRLVPGLLVVALLMLSLSACRLPGGTPVLGAGAGAPAATGDVAREAPPLSGRAYFARRAAQASMDDVAIGATVSLINTGSNTTVATGLTDAQGRFSIALPRGFVFDNTATYYIEAYKGLNGNQPGHDVARVRTVAKLVNGAWLTLTNGAADGDVVVGPASTAVALGAALRKGTATPVDFDALIGKLSGNVFSPVPNLSGADFTALFTMVQEGLIENRDPVQTIGYDSIEGVFERVDVAPSQFAVESISPTSGVVGSTVTITGRGFSKTASDHIVRFNGVPAVPEASTETTLTVRVPPGGTSGTTTAQLRGVITLGPIFTVQVVVDSFAPASAAPGASITLTGSGFDLADLSKNAVRFAGGAMGTVTAATATTLTLTVPSGAVSGPLSASVSGSQTAIATPLTVPVSVTGLNPFVVRPSGTFTVTGTGFGSSVASVSASVAAQACQVLAASPASLTLRAPGSEMTGALSVTVEGQTGTSATNLRVFVGLSPDATIAKLAGSRLAPPGTLATNWGLSPNGGVTFDSSGNYYFCASNAVYKVDTANRLSMVAGQYDGGFSGDGGPALNAKLNSPNDVAVDGEGNVYIADANNYRVRKVDATGVITTIAGTGTSGYSGDGGSALTARFNYCPSIEVDGAGNLYIADVFNYRIRRVAASGIVSTVVGTGVQGWSGDGGAATEANIDYPIGLAFDAAGNLYFADYTRHVVRRVTPAGVISTVAGAGGAGFWGDGGLATSAYLRYPRDVAVDAGGNLYIADADNHRIRKVTPDGTITTIVGTGGNVYSGDGGAAVNAGIPYPKGVALDVSGNLYIAQDYRVRKVDLSGNIATVVGNGSSTCSGDGGPALNAQLYSPADLKLDAAGNLYVADTNNNRIRKIDPAGIITTVAGNGASGFAGDSGPAVDAKLNSPYAVAVEADGSLYIADTYNNRVRKVAPDGTISTIAGDGTSGYEGDGAAAASAKIGNVYGLALDAAGNLYLSDSSYNVVRRVTPGGVISTVVGTGTAAYGGDGGQAANAQLRNPNGLAFDAAGNLYIADNGNHRIRKVTPGGIISTVAGTGINGFTGDGGPATSARIYSPTALCLDSAGNLYFADATNYRIRKVTPEGIISPVAGTGASGYAGDGAAALGAQLGYPRGVAVNSAGTRLYLGDNTYHSLRVIE
ncbi:MAG TPA: IPT/TIG domain-containing protein [Pantanalinema sp.]